MFQILIVDDSRDDLEFAERILRQGQILNPIHLFTTGAACIGFLRQQGPKNDPCLIFMDLSMPSMNGVETIAAINQMPLESEPWIVMVSAWNEMKLIRAGYQAGARTFLTKPLQTADVNLFILANQRSIILKMTDDGYELHWAMKTQPVLDQRL